MSALCVSISKSHFLLHLFISLISANFTLFLTLMFFHLSSLVLLKYRHVAFKFKDDHFSDIIFDLRISFNFFTKIFLRKRYSQICNIFAL